MAIIRDERSQFIEDTVEPSVFLPGIISLVIMCIGIIWNNSFLVGRRARAEAWIDPRPLRTSRSTAHGAQVVWPLDYMGRTTVDVMCTCMRIVSGIHLRHLAVLSGAVWRCSVQCLQFISKTHMFFSCSHDGTIKQWDADSFELITTLQVSSLIWSVCVLIYFLCRIR